MITNDLTKSILIDPMTIGANRLYIVSGYATATMVAYHFEEIHEELGKKFDISIHLLIGMCAEEGLSYSNHRALQNLVNNEFNLKFHCSYYKEKPAVHSKVYSWLNNDLPVKGFIGSANYTQSAFKGKKCESMDNCDPSEAFNYFKSLESDSIYCTHQDAEQLIKIYSDSEYYRRSAENLVQDDETSPASPSIKGLEHENISLLRADGKMHNAGGGLNWGQPTKSRSGRNRNQSYIPLRAKVSRSDFFPEKKTHFTVLTDNGLTLICVRAQEVSAKAIHTPLNNAHLGEYLRKRIGVSSGAFINKADLEKYGRTHVDFYKIDDETYYMNFSVE